MKRGIAVVAAAVFVLSGCHGNDEEEAAPAPTAEESSSAPATPVDYRLAIEELNVESSLIPLKLDDKRRHEVPPITAPEQAGWYEPGPEPGQNGPAIILGHVNGSGRPGVFAELGKLDKGDEVVVNNDTYSITRIVTVEKEDFATLTQDIYGPTDGPELRLITCGGAFDYAADRYSENVVAFAEKV
jgi:LPXTG-site transpeptidase (sortase) family protein